MPEDLDRPPKRLKRRWFEAIEDVGGVRQHFLLAVGARFLGADGTGHVSQPAIAAYMGKGERSVRRLFAWAIEDGWLARLSRGHRRGDGTVVASKYAMSLPATYLAGSEEAQPASPDVSTGQNGGLNRPPEWPPTSPSTSPSTNRVGGRQAVDLIAEYYSCPIDDAERAWSEMERRSSGPIRNPVAFARRCLETKPDLYRPVSTPLGVRFDPSCPDCWGSGMATDADDRAIPCQRCRGDSSPPPRSTTNERVNAGLRLARKYAREEQDLGAMWKMP